jgi:hypothetical protein
VLDLRVRPVTLNPVPGRALSARRRVFVSAFAAVLGVGTLLRSLALYDSPRAGSREASLVTQIVEFTRYGVHGTLQLGDLPVYLVSLATPQLAAIEAATGAWGRAPNALGAVRESGVVLWLAVSLLVWTVARRSGAGRGWSVCALAVLAVAPAAVTAARQASPENVAALWSLAAMALAMSQRGSRSWWTGLGLVACLSLAVLSSPVALGALPTVLLLYRRRADTNRVALVTGAALFIAGLGAATALATATSSTVTANVHGHTPDWLNSGIFGPDLVTPALGLLVVLVAPRLPAVQPAAVGLVLLPALGMMFGAPVAALTVPLLSVSLAIIGSRRAWDRLPGVLGRDHQRVAVLAATALVAGLAVSYTPTLHLTQSQPTQRARAWLAANVAPDQRVLTDRRTRVALVAGDSEWDRIETVEACRRTKVLPPAIAMPKRHCSEATLWITDPSVRSGMPPGNPLITVFDVPGSRHRIEVRGTDNTTQRTTGLELSRPN